MAGGALINPLVKAVAKGVTKTGKKFVQKGLGEVAETVIQKGAKEVVPEFGEQFIKNVDVDIPTPRQRSTDNWWRGHEDSGSIPKRSDTGKSIFEDITIKEIKAHDSATGGEGRSDWDTLFEGARSEDPVIRYDAYEGISELTSSIHLAGHVEELGQAQINTIRQIDGFSEAPKPKAWNIYDELTSDKSVAMYKDAVASNPGNFLDEGRAFDVELGLQEKGNLYKYLESQGNEVNAEVAAFLQTTDPGSRAAYMDLILDAADGDEGSLKIVGDMFESLKAERLPAERITQEGGERLTPDLINQAKDTTRVYQGAQADLTKRGMGDKVLSALSTSPELVSGDARIYQLGTTARKIFAQYEQLLEGVDLPTLQWHHKFQKAVSAPYFQRAWELVNANPPLATVEDIIAMHRYALDQGVGAGDRLSAIMMIERIPHTELHNFAKAAGLQPSQATVKGNKYDITGKRTRPRPSTNSELKKNSNRISKINNIADLAEDFQRSVQDAMQVTEEGMKLQKAWDEIPVTERSRLTHFHNLRNAQGDLLRKNSRKKLSPEEILDAKKEYDRFDGIYKKIKDRILDTLEKNRSKQEAAEFTENIQL